MGFKLYVALLSFADADGGGAYPSNETLSVMVGVGERSVQLCRGLFSESSLGFTIVTPLIVLSKTLPPEN